MRRVVTLLGVLLLAATSASAQTLASKTITTANAACTTTSCLVMGVRGLTAIGFDVTGAGTYAVAVEGLRGDDATATWRAVPYVNDAAPSTVVTSALSAEGSYTVANTGYTAIRFRTTSLVSGTPVISAARGFASGSGGGGGGGGAVSITQGGNTAAVNASSQLSVNCANCSGTGVSQLEDTAFVDGGATTPAGVQRQDTLTTTTSLDGDVSVLKSDTQGRLYTTGTGGTFPVSGTAATDAPVSGNPIYAAGRASAAAPTDVSADGDVVPNWLLRNGAQVIQQAFAGVLAATGNGVSGTGVQRVTIASDSTGTLAATQSGTWNVTNISGTVSLPTGAATSANQATEITALQLIDNIPITIGSTTSGQSGALAMGAVSTTAPTYTNAQSHPLSLTPGGLLRVAVEAGGGTGGTSSSIGSAFPATATAVGFSDGTNMQGARAFDADSGAGSQYVLGTNLRFTASGGSVEAFTASTPGIVAGAVTPADGASNPTNAVPMAAYLMSFNGTTWDRAQGSKDACDGGAKVFVAISQTTSTQLFAGTASNKTHVCSITIMQPTASTQTYSLVSGTGSVCATGTTAMIGATTAANGLQQPFSAGSGSGTIAKSGANADNVCLLQSGTDRLTGVIGYGIAP